MKHTIITIVVAAALAVVALSPIANAAAASATVEHAKTECIAGEQADGYLGIIDEAKASESLKREIRDINQQRKAYYAEIAQRNGVTIEVTGTLTAQKLIEQAPSGQCVRDQQRRWMKKP